MLLIKVATWREDCKTDRVQDGLNVNDLDFDWTESGVSALDCRTVDAVCLFFVFILVLFTSNPVSSLLTSSWTQTDGGGNP